MTQTPDHPTGTIVSGPTPEDDGNVTFGVKVEDRIVVGLANPCGYGFRGDILADLDTANAAMRAVSRFAQEHPGSMLPLYREAARLRRAAGKPPFAGNTRREKVRLIGPAVLQRNGGALFTTKAGETEIKIWIFGEGGFIDHCDDWAAVSDEDRDEAFTVSLDYVLSHPDQAIALGLDAGLLDELWR